MPFEIKKAVRRALPLQLAFVGPTNSGKTLSALLFAAGLIDPGQRVVVIDTERGRASLYAENKRVLAVMPQGFDVIELDAPYAPARFIAAIDVAEAAGYKVCLIDSVSDSWDGPGGCSDMAEAAKNTWNKAKLQNKKLMTRIALSSMHIICCLKAQDKVKIIPKEESGTGKQEFLSLGMQPICEKNFFFPMTLAFEVDPKTHIATCTKTHDDIADVFKEPRLITMRDGQLVRRWIDGGAAVGDEQLVKRSKEAAREGMEAYAKFFKSLTAVQKKALAPVHADNKNTAEAADAIPVFGSATDPVEWPDAFDGPQLIWNGKHLRMNEETGNYTEVKAKDQAA